MEYRSIDAGELGPVSGIEQDVRPPHLVSDALAGVESFEQAHQVVRDIYRLRVEHGDQVAQEQQYMVAGMLLAIEQQGGLVEDARLIIDSLFKDLEGPSEQDMAYLALHERFSEVERLLDDADEDVILDWWEVDLNGQLQLFEQQPEVQEDKLEELGHLFAFGQLWKMSKDYETAKVAYEYWVQMTNASPLDSEAFLKEQNLAEVLSVAEMQLHIGGQPALDVPIDDEDLLPLARQTRNTTHYLAMSMGFAEVADFRDKLAKDTNRIMALRRLAMAEYDLGVDRSVEPLPSRVGQVGSLIGLTAARAAAALGMPDITYGGTLNERSSQWDVA